MPSQEERMRARKGSCNYCIHNIGSEREYEMPCSDCTCLKSTGNKNYWEDSQTKTTICKEEKTND